MKLLQKKDNTMKKNFYKIGGISLTVLALLFLSLNYSRFNNSADTDSKKNKIQNNETQQKTNSQKEQTTMKQENHSSAIQSDNAFLLDNYSRMEAHSIIDVTTFSKKERKSLFTSSEIDEATFSRMQGKSYKNNCTVPREDLRYLRLLHKDLDGNTRIGELIVNKSIAKKVKNLFFELYEKDYPIEKMLLVDEYNADDNKSMADNNTSSFNFRVIEGTTKLSKHSLGLAIDINPRYNPYIHTLNGKVVCSPKNGEDYVDRSKDFPYKIDTSDLAYRLFTEAGFEWGGAWNSSKDYQHFQIDN